MSIKVRLEDGTEEKFHKSHIIESLEAVGVDHATAKRIANEIEQHKGISEHEIKVKIFDKLDKIDPKIADRYMRTKKVHVHSESLQVNGNALIPEYLMEYLDLKNGDKLDVIHGNNINVLRAMALKDLYSQHSHDLIYLSRGDMLNMDVKDRSQVAICKHFTEL